MNFYVVRCIHYVTDRFFFYSYCICKVLRNTVSFVRPIVTISFDIINIKLCSMCAEFCDCLVCTDFIFNNSIINTSYAVACNAHSSQFTCSTALVILVRVVNNLAYNLVFNICISFKITITCASVSNKIRSVIEFVCKAGIFSNRSFYNCKAGVTVNVSANVIENLFALIKYL